MQLLLYSFEHLGTYDSTLAVLRFKSALNICSFVVARPRGQISLLQLVFYEHVSLLLGEADRLALALSGVELIQVGTVVQGSCALVLGESVVLLESRSSGHFESWRFRS